MASQLALVQQAALIDAEHEITALNSQIQSLEERIRAAACAGDLGDADDLRRDLADAYRDLGRWLDVQHWVLSQ